VPIINTNTLTNTTATDVYQYITVNTSVLWYTDMMPCQLIHSSMPAKILHRNCQCDQTYVVLFHWDIVL